MGSAGTKSNTKQVSGLPEHTPFSSVSSLEEYQALSSDVAGDLSKQAYTDTLQNFEWYELQGMNSFNSVQGLVELLGMHGKPIVLADADYDAQMAANALDGVELYRGLGSGGSAFYQQELLFGDKTFIGDGVHGAGIYFTTSASEADSYAGPDKTTSTVTAFIDKSKAKVITEDALGKLLATEPVSVQEKFSTTSGMNAYALYKGFNVIHCPGGNLTPKYSHANGGSDFYIPLTREVLVFREHTRLG